jgi:uncharacterized membrane protein
MRVARWVAPVTTGLALSGVAVSVYLTIAHFTDPDLLVCGDSETVSCSTVTSSAQATFVGVPVALLGLLWFVGMLVLCLPAAWNANWRYVHLARVIGVLGGIGFVLWLVYAELIIIGAICLWCTVAHVIALALFVVVVLTASDVLSEA